MKCLKFLPICASLFLATSSGADLEIEQKGFLSNLANLAVEAVQSIKDKLNQSQWMKLKHLFLTNPHLPLILLSGQQLTYDDVVNKPEWLAEELGIQITTTTESPETTTSFEEDLCNQKHGGICKLGLDELDDLKHLCIHLITGVIGTRNSLPV